MVTNNSDIQSYLIDSHAWNTICRLISNKYKESNKKDVLDSKDWGNYLNNSTTKYEKLKGLWALHNYKDDWTVAGEYKTETIPSGTAPKNVESEKRLELATGMSEDFKAYNIYDLAGNMWEWTTETGTPPAADQPGSGDGNCNEGTCPEGEDDLGVIRGGGFNNNGTSYPVVCARGDYQVWSKLVFHGFRAVLYWK